MERQRSQVEMTCQPSLLERWSVRLNQGLQLFIERSQDFQGGHELGFPKHLPYSIGPAYQPVDGVRKPGGLNQYFFLVDQAAPIERELNLPDTARGAVDATGDIGLIEEPVALYPITTRVSMGAPKMRLVIPTDVQRGAFFRHWRISAARITPFRETPSGIQGPDGSRRPPGPPTQTAPQGLEFRPGSGCSRHG